MALKFPPMTFKITGDAPLLMHNERLANPMDPATKRLKAITAVRKKTDDDHIALARAEFDGSLYIDDEGPYVPDHWVSAMLRDGGKFLKLGKAVTQGVLILANKFPLELDKSAGKAADSLWKNGFYDQRMVGNQKVRVLRTRPRFDRWAITCTINFDPSVFDARQLAQILEISGIKVGLGDYRPRFGRFNAEII